MRTDHMPRRTATPHTLWHADALEWEELPSLADSLAQRLVRLGERHSASADGLTHVDAAPSSWADTAPADLDGPVTTSEPFREVLNGLSTREVTEPDVFRHFFGAATAR
jgi:hypothetical protein